MTCDLPCPTPGYCADQDGGCANDNAMRDASRGLDSVVEWVPFPVVTDPAMPPDTFVIGSPAAPPRVFMAPAGSPPGVSHEWVEVGTLASAPEWSIGPTFEEHVADSVIRGDFFRTDETFTLTLDATPRARDPYAYKRLPDAAPVDVWDVLLGEDFPGTRMAVHRAAMTRLAAACHRAARDQVVYAALERGRWAPLREHYSLAVLHPRDFVSLSGWGVA